MPLTVIHQGTETIVDDRTTALIGSDATSTIRIVRPGISRRHALLSHDGTGWKIEDAGSRNGTFVDGKRITVTSLDGSTTCFLGHPTDGEKITLVPASSPAKTDPVAATPSTSASRGMPAAATPAAATPAAATPAAATGAAAASATTKKDDAPSGATPSRATAPTRVQPSTKPAAAAPVSTRPSSNPPSDVEIAQLTSAIRDQVKSIRNLTWSVWAMIAVTAALIVLTLFVGILSN